MEFLICLWIASLLTGIRPITDMVQALKGKEPAHLTKAKLQAKREAERNAARLARAENRGVRPGEDLPTFGDAFRVWRRSLWQDAIDYRRRTSAEKAAQQHEDRQAVAEGRQPERRRPALADRLKRFGRLLWEPVGDNEATPTEPVVEDKEEPLTVSRPAAVDERPFPTQLHTNYNADVAAMEKLNEQRRSERAAELASQDTEPAPTPEPPSTDNIFEGEPMTDATQAGTATGDAHDVESALAECDALDNDLTAINTALDVIDENIDSAGTAAELIEQFLASKNVDDAAVGGMSVARDMLSPTHIKALMDAVAAAKQGVQNAIAELQRLQELESQLNGADGSVLNGR